MSNPQSQNLLDLSNQLARAVARGAESIVAVHARPQLASTGVHWRDGFVVTTNGTVRRDRDVAVTLPDGTRIGAAVQGRDPATDLAVLKVAGGALPVAAFGDAGALRPGHLVLALARVDETGPRAAFGAVSVVAGAWRPWGGGEIDRLLQSDVNLYPGFGGGPLVDTEGQVLGINSGRLSRPYTTTLPVQTVNRVLDQLASHGYVRRGYLGAAMQPVRLQEQLRSRLGIDRDGGLLVSTIQSDSPSAAGGLLVGDVVLAIGGKPVAEPEDVLKVLNGDTAGRTLALKLVRGGRLETVDVLIGERPRGH
ncbi:MAG: trypsin-like peptidase domain-containing protein [Gemmatimonadales bacterium]|nr:trypsin-like peptidase domain-containing protein [Gemmatimonadales bacterium]